jgi:6,7-dimethyl-8-ribityllumazine synthase
MVTVIEGQTRVTRCSFGIVVSRFNEFITRRLLDGALDCLHQHGVDDASIDVVYCPGAFEIPHIAQTLALLHRYDALICLGCVIRGETPHFEYVATAVSAGLSRVILDTKTPVTFGILTTESFDQAVERAGGKSGNKGWDAALAAIELVDLHRKLAARKKRKSKP